MNNKQIFMHYAGRSKNKIILSLAFFTLLLLVFYSFKSTIINPELPAPQTLEYYKTQSIMTNPGKYSYLYDNLPQSPLELTRVVQGVLLHIFHTESYGVHLTKERKEEVRVRKVEDVLECIMMLDNRPLSQPRDPNERMISHCRDYAVLLCSFLRHRGIPARVRVGFADYFIPEVPQSHWLCEYWCQTKGKWVKIDAQLDSIQIDFYKIDFDPMDVPADKFLYAGEEYKHPRIKSVDLSHSDSQNTEDSSCVIRRCLIQDFLALNKMEVEIWDVTNYMDVGRHANPAYAKILRRIANMTTSSRDRLSEIKETYQRYDGLKISDD